ncbi:MAG: hypothetical protein KJ950_13950 [Proteobacteria bacterium]|nr:hypothetical protein [Pseudomonadota bacterium]MBU1686113.1 hypothetical protein [Pseudomonadota bacterium]
MELKKSIFIIIVVVATIYGLKYTQDTKFEDSEIASFEYVDWQTKTFDDIGIEVELPFEMEAMKIDLPPALRENIKEMINYNFNSTPVSLFISRLVANDGISGDLDKAAEGAIAEFSETQDMSDLVYTVSEIYEQDMNGRRVDGTFQMKGRPAEITAKIFSSGTRLYQIVLLKMSHQENMEVADKIFNSLNINKWK